MRKLLIASLLVSWPALAQVGPSNGGLQPQPVAPRGQIPGGLGTAPTAGNIGQLLSSNIACSTTTGLTSGTTATITTLSLTPGTWTLYGAWAADGNSGTTFAYMYGGISPTSSGTGGGNGYTNYYGFYSGATGIVIAPALSSPGISVTSTTTYYLTLNASFSGSTAGGCGSLYAVRIG